MNEHCTTIAVIDDEYAIRENIQEKLISLGHEVLLFDNAEDVLKIINDDLNKIGLIITDIKLPKIDGIELLRKTKLLDKPIPVLIISGHGNVDEVVSALRLGASDFIQKPFDVNDLIYSVKSTLKSIHEKEIENNFSQYLDYKKVGYVIPVDSAIINPLSHKLVKDLVLSGICSHGTAENVSFALKEAINNAMFHGNLEVPSSLREKGGIKLFNEEIEIRRKDPKYSERKIFITHKQTKKYVEYTIEDEGPGFNYENLPDPRKNFYKNSGRGILIIKLHMDEVNWNEKGNKIILRKNKES